MNLQEAEAMSSEISAIFAVAGLVVVDGAFSLSSLRDDAEVSFRMHFADGQKWVGSSVQDAVDFVNSLKKEASSTEPAVSEEKAEPVVLKPKRDGFDKLRNELSPLVQMSIEYPFSDQVVIKLSIPNPVQFQPSIHTRYFMETEYVKHSWYADTGWTSYPEERKRISNEAWREKMSDWANRMLKEAQTDPVKFFSAEGLWVRG
jgi:hypothetical protein